MGLEAWELPALARLRALRELDLDLLRAAQVLGRHAEAARRDLLISKLRNCLPNANLVELEKCCQTHISCKISF